MNNFINNNNKKFSSFNAPNQHSTCCNNAAIQMIALNSSKIIVCHKFFCFFSFFSGFYSGNSIYKWKSTAVAITK